MYRMLAAPRVIAEVHRGRAPELARYLQQYTHQSQHPVPTLLSTHIGTLATALAVIVVVTGTSHGQSFLFRILVIHNQGSDGRAGRATRTIVAVMSWLDYSPDHKGCSEMDKIQSGHLSARTDLGRLS